MLNSQIRQKAYISYINRNIDLEAVWCTDANAKMA